MSEFDEASKVITSAEKVLQETGIMCFVTHHQPEIFKFLIHVVILQQKNGPECNHQCFLKVWSFEAAPSGAAGLVLSGDDVTFHWRNGVDAERLEPSQENRPMLNLTHFSTTTGKIIHACRDFDLKSSELHQEKRKGKTKTMVDDL